MDEEKRHGKMMKPSCTENIIPESTEPLCNDENCQGGSSCSILTHSQLTGSYFEPKRSKHTEQLRFVRQNIPHENSAYMNYGLVSVAEQSEQRFVQHGNSSSVLTCSRVNGSYFDPKSGKPAVQLHNPRQNIPHENSARMNCGLVSGAEQSEQRFVQHGSSSSVLTCSRVNGSYFEPKSSKHTEQLQFVRQNIPHENSAYMNYGLVSGAEQSERRFVQHGNSSSVLTCSRVNRSFFDPKSRKPAEQLHYAQKNILHANSAHMNCEPISKAEQTERRFVNSRSDTNVVLMSSRELELLEWKSPEMILYTILNGDPGFSALMRQPCIHHKEMSALLQLLYKASNSHLHHNVVVMINYVFRSDEFLLNKFYSFLCTYKYRQAVNDEWLLHSFLSLSELLLKILKFVPFRFLEPSLDLLQINVQLLELACRTYLRGDDQLCLLISKNVRNIETKMFDLLQDPSSRQLEPPTGIEVIEDYRTTPVLPTIRDIHSPCTLLKPNVIKGRYEDGKHYLDVQFRLCREDYVKTIRDGVVEYLSIKKQGKSVNNCKNVRVYTDVHIIQQEFVNGVLVHLARFADEKFSKTKWEHSKRFLTGSLLCLSSDDFETVLLATVVRRQPKELCEGLLLLRFEEITGEILTLSRLRSFVVIETSAYFEAYRHNLQSLQEIDVGKIPMRPYIVEVQKIVFKTAYITDSTFTIYDIRPLLLPLHKASIKGYIQEDGKAKPIYKFDSLPDKRISGKAKEVSIFYNQCWPHVSDMNLDPDQYAAIKAALTKQFVLIQGPPGTGKTYVGLRIVQLLLHNMRHFEYGKDRPIIVVCYTNHALDQFLEGVLLFARQIVRIGGRSTNQVISQYQLHNLIKSMELRKQIPNSLFKLIQRKKYELRCLMKSVSGIKQYIEMCYSTVLDEDSLKDCMSEIHRATLKSTSHFVSDEFVMHNWLGIRLGSEDQCLNQSSCKSHETKISDVSKSNIANQNATKLDEYEEECDETEVENIEAFRSITSQEFADFKIDELMNKDELSQKIPEPFGKISESKCKQFIADNLTKVKAMTEQDVRKIEDIIILSLNDRWRLYKFWMELHISKKQKEILQIQKEIDAKLAELNELQLEVDLIPCLRADVIGMTTTGAAKYRHIIRRVKPLIFIFEEAAEILESHIVTSLTSSTDQVIMIGDHQQLKPSPCVHELAVQYDLDVSLFERMVKNGVPCYRLRVQHRMRPDIAALLVPHFYDDLKNHQSVMKYENIKGIKKNVFFVTRSYNELHEFDSKSKVNQHEATFLIKLCKFILLQGYAPSQITVLTTYSGQLLLLKKLAGEDILKGVKFCVVDNYQGEETDIVLVSFVRSNEEGEIGFLKVPNRVCVALSRARKALYCIGNFGMLMEKSPIWKNIVQILEEREAIGQSLHLSCQNHPEFSKAVSCDKDFHTLREGGCNRVCDFSLTCGHSCQLLCHPYDIRHENVKCMHLCKRKCNYGHPCKKFCFEDCGHCTVLVERQMEPCGHIINVNCHTRQCREQKCTANCEKLLACGHQCQNSCSSECTSKCLKKERKVSPICGHAVEVECYNSGNLEHLAEICKEPCYGVFPCGHKCPGTCSKCYQGRLHVSCTQPCKKILICGHKCTSSCSRNCPPCNYACENRCSHGQCPRRCCEPCVKCSQPCEWICPHKKCDRFCVEKCSRDICYESCDKMLNCGHSCIGLCGEPCPEICGKCDTEKVHKRLLGSERKKNVRFVLLEDCGHMFEFHELVRWMQAFVQEGRKIQPITCPRCKVIIRKNSCFEKYLKSCLEDIEKVKDITCGNMYRNFYIQISLMEKIKSNIHQVSEICQPTIKALKSLYGRTLTEILTMENLFTLAMSLVKGTAFFENLSEVSDFKDPQVQILFQELIEYMSLNKKLFINFIRDEYLTATDYQLQELSWEILHLALADKLLKFIYDKKTINWDLQLSSFTQRLISFKPFRKENAKISAVQFQKLLLRYPDESIDISELAKPTPLKMVSLLKGHWYMCPLQHPCFSMGPGTQCGVCGSKIQTEDDIGNGTDTELDSTISEMKDILYSLTGLYASYQ